jgi:rRNA pseudouridine-1189 N-methylase Emg1 (Nep1/Mra1 family)
MPQIETRASHRVAKILQRCTSEIVERWLVRIRENKELNHLSLTDNELTGYLPKLIEDLIVRLKEPNVSFGERSHCVCFAAVAHGKMRKEQGYTAGMLVHESRILEVTLSETLQSNQRFIRFPLAIARCYDYRG